MYAILFFGLLTITIAVCFLLLEQYFLSIAQLLLYTGNIMLFLLSTAMFIGKNTNKKKVKNNTYNYIIFPILCCIILCTQLPIMPYKIKNIILKQNTTNHIFHLGDALFNKYFIIFESIALVLLLTIVGIVCLYQSKTDNKA